MDDDIERSARRAQRAVVLCSVANIVWFSMVFLSSHRPGLGSALAVLLLWLYAGIRWLQWFRPAYRVVIAAGRARFEGWVSFWGWVIPGLAAFMPRWLAEDVWRAPDPVGYHTPLPKPVRTWWLLWCIAGLLSLFDRGRGPRLLGVVGFILVLVSTPWAVQTIRILTERVVLLQARNRAAVHGDHAASQV